MRYVFAIVFSFLCSINLLAQKYTNAQIDSLVGLYYTYDDRDTMKMYICNLLANHYEDEDSLLAFSLRLQALAQKNGSVRYEISSLYSLAYIYYYNGDYEESNTLCYRGLKLADSAGMFSSKSKIEVLIAQNYSYMGNYALSDEYFNRALQYNRQNGDTVGTALIYSYLARNYSQQRMWDRAEELFKIAIELDSLVDNPREMALMYYDISDMYYLRFTLERADPHPEYITEGKMNIFKSMALFYDEPYYRYSACFSLVRFLYQEAKVNEYSGDQLSKTVEAIELYYKDGLDAVNQLNFDLLNLLYAKSRVWLYLIKQERPQAKMLLDSIAEKVFDGGQALEEFVPDIYSLYDDYYTAVGDTKMVLYYRSKYYERMASVQSVDYIVSSTQKLADTQYQDDIRRREAEAERNKRLAIYISIGVFLILAFIVFENFRKRKHNRILNEKNIILQSQKEEIMTINSELAKSNKQITDSINYASLIQKAALPRPEDLSAIFGKYFLIYRPLNIVAGDFYWASQVGRFSILVCADCTGHGVPGAFVSMLGVSLLNEVTANIAPYTKASDVLNELRAKLMRALGQSKRKYDNGAVYSMDGMDLAMVMIDYETMTLQFAGAYRPLWIWRDGELIQHKPDKMPIGLYLGPEKDFTNHELEIQEGDVLYMFSDGIPDQFGYTDDTHTTCKHFSTKRLAALLTEIGGDPLSSQKERIESEVDTWKNGYKQLDDNILIGVRI